jgi:hypothetical protein
MFHQPSSGLHQPLLQAREGPVLNPSRQTQAPPQVPQIVGQQAQRQPHLVRAETMARQARHLHRLLAFLDPLLRRPPLVVEPHHCPTRRLQIGHNEPHTGEQLSGMVLHLGHYSSCEEEAEKKRIAERKADEKKQSDALAEQRKAEKAEAKAKADEAKAAKKAEEAKAKADARAVIKAQKDAAKIAAKASREAALNAATPEPVDAMEVSA